jgi:DNA invertase Pin-like site-specific DNA recombinase
MQRDEIAAEADRRGYVIGERYEETASAKTTARPVLNRLRADIRAGKWQALFLWKLDRLCRSGIRDAFILVDECREAGCKVISLHDAFDVDGPAGELLLAVFAWGAKVERETISMRVRAGMAAARRQGVHIGRPRVHVDVVRAVRLLGEGRSLRRVAKVLGVAASTLCRSLQQHRAATGVAEDVVREGACGPPPPEARDHEVRDRGGEPPQACSARSALWNASYRCT